MTPDASAIEMMRHAVSRPHRNYYCAEVGGPEWSQWEGLVTLGLARAGFKINEQRDQYFHLTAEGRDYLRKLDGEARAATRAAQKPPPARRR